MWPVVAAVGASLAAGAMGADAAEDAASAQAASADRGIGEQRRQFDLTRRDQAPFQATGVAANTRLGDLLGLKRDPLSLNAATPKGAISVTDWARSKGFNTPDGREWNDSELQNLHAAGYKNYLQEFIAANPQEDPADFGALNRKFSMEDMNADPVMKASFDFGLSEGEKAVKRMFGAKGLSRSGGAVKALTRFASDYTNQKGGEAYNRFYADQDRTFNRLSGVSGTGQTAATTVANAGANMANNISGMEIGAGNARGAASIARGNAMGGALTGAANQVLGQSTLDQILNRGGINPQRQFSMEPTSNFDYSGWSAAGGNQYG